MQGANTGALHEKGQGRQVVLFNFLYKSEHCVPVVKIPNSLFTQLPPPLLISWSKLPHVRG